MKLMSPGAGGGLVWVVTVAKAGEPATFVGTEIAIVARMRAYGRIALLLTQADEPPLVADELRLLFAMRLAVT